MATDVLEYLRRRLVEMRRDAFELEQVIHDLEHRFKVGDSVTTSEGLDGEVVEVDGNTVRIRHHAPFADSLKSRFHVFHLRSK